jgi:hypothetical protein
MLHQHASVITFIQSSLDVIKVSQWMEAKKSMIIAFGSQDLI